MKPLSTAVATLAVLIAPALASPMATTTNAATATAADIPDGPAATALDPGPASLTIRVTNKAGVDLTTYQSPLQQTGIIRNGAVAVNYYPQKWNGSIAINSHKYFAPIGDESLIEASYDDKDAAFAVVDVDISYVDGFSYPIMCYCAANGAYLSGCDKKLWTLGNKCPSNNGKATCVNPKRKVDLDNVTPDPFFAPCKGLAYT
ncbi:hypothetical protein B0T19DRAFT_445304 [Cercophora scortea]|uniref:Uncharacterized protein n=1 Tax=Cercophora scortea TaxID=314031 RepID=A0AAE0I6R2_9PEZI|nr:hypothetical protein B0T19DRAFT_445304 [Cercophora scortea]